MPDLTEYPPARDARCPLDPPSAYADLRAEPVLGRAPVWDGSRPWLVTRYDDVRQALSDRALSADYTLPGFPHPTAASAAHTDHPHTFITRDDPESRRDKARLASEFAPRRAGRLRPVIRRIVDEALDAMLAGPAAADLVEVFAVPVATAVMGELLGVAPGDRERLHALCRVVASRSASRAEAGAAMGDLNAYFLEVVRDRVRSQPADQEDFVGRLAAYQLHESGSTEDEVAAAVQFLFHGGHGTSAYMISTGTALLLRHRDQFDAVLADPDPARMTAAVEELLRYITTSRRARGRIAVKDTVVAETPIRAGDGLLIHLEAANRDPAVFPDPDRLDLSRAVRRNLALGYGDHHCLGRPLVLVELEEVYRTLFLRVPSLRLAVPFEELTFRLDENAIGLDSLPVLW